MFLCTKHIEALRVSAACISTVDSNNAIYMLYFAPQISIPTYIEIATCDRQRCLDIRNIVSEIREEFCLALSALHSFTGNNYTAPFTELVKLKR